MNIFHAILKTAAISYLICISTASAQFMDTKKWLGWQNSTTTTTSHPYFSAYINFSATVNPYETWTSPDNGSTLKGTVFQINANGPLSCYEVETRIAGAGGTVDTKIWRYPVGTPRAVADDPDGQAFAKFVTWGGGQFIITTFSSAGSNSHFQLFATNRTDINSELACRNIRPTWSYVGGGIYRYF